MKKAIKLCLFIIALTLNITLIKAADFSSSISGSINITAGETVTLNFKVTSSYKLLGITASLNYDKTKLSLVSSGTSSGFNLTLGNNIVVDSTTGKSGTFTYATIKFKALAAFNLGDTTTVSITSIKGSDGTETYTGTTSKINLKMKSNNNNLSDLKLDGKTIDGFKSQTTTYKIIVSELTSKVNITATSSDAKATIKGLGTKNLEIYNNTFKIIVTSESGSSKTYTLNIIRKDTLGNTSKRSSNNILKTLEIENFDLDFDPNVNNYELKVNNEIEKLNIIALPEDNSAKVEIIAPDLKVGINKISIVVTSEDESINEYVITVTRSDDNPQITIDEFNKISASTTKETIEVLITKNQIIHKEELEMIKKSSKNVIFSYYENDRLIYAWHLKNEDILTDNPYDTSVTCNNDVLEKFLKETNYAEQFCFSIKNKNKSKAKLKLYINDLDQENKLYYYDKELHFDQNVQIKDNYLEIPVLYENYFLTRAELNKSTFNVWILLFGIENVILGSFGAYLYIKSKKRTLKQTV